MTDSLSDHLDDNIPEEVLDDPSWEPRLLPDLEDMHNSCSFENIGPAEYDDLDL